MNIIEGDTAMSNLKLQLLSGVEYKLKDRKTLLTRMIYKVRQSLDGSITEEGILLKCSAPTIEGMSGSLSVYPPDLLLFKNQGDGVELWTKKAWSYRDWETG